VSQACIRREVLGASVIEEEKRASCSGRRSEQFKIGWKKKEKGGGRDGHCSFCLARTAYGRGFTNPSSEREGVWLRRDAWIGEG